MDLTAFLAPGVYPVFLADCVSDGEPWGHVLCRPGRRLSWLAQESAETGQRLLLTLKIPGYFLDCDGSLRNSGGSPDISESVDEPRSSVPAPQTEAVVVISGQVRRCRLSPAGNFVLRLADLMRLLD